jgi:hypothetical protein
MKISRNEKCPFCGTEMINIFHELDKFSKMSSTRFDCPNYEARAIDKHYAYAETMSPEYLMEQAKQCCLGQMVDGVAYQASYGYSSKSRVEFCVGSKLVWEDDLIMYSLSELKSFFDTSIQQRLFI